MQVTASIQYMDNAVQNLTIEDASIHQLLESVKNQTVFLTPSGAVWIAKEKVRTITFTPIKTDEPKVFTEKTTDIPPTKTRRPGRPRKAKKQESLVA